MDFENQIKSVTEYWNDKMPIMTCEECGELIQAISKMERNNCDESRKRVITEAADVIISINALLGHYGIDQHSLLHAITEKLSKIY